MRVRCLILEEIEKLKVEFIFSNEELQSSTPKVKSFLEELLIGMQPLNPNGVFPDRPHVTAFKLAIMLIEMANEEDKKLRKELGCSSSNEGENPE